MFIRKNFLTSSSFSKFLKKNDFYLFLILYYLYLFIYLITLFTYN